MELSILIVCLLIFVETTVLVFKKRGRVRSGKRKIYIDTSALIDGRILNIARSGFLDGDVIVLKSVLRELQLLADGKDPEKRVRARAGLETVLELERVVNINTIVFDDGEGRKKVDEELLRFAKENKGAVLTIDYNLIKVAEAENIETLNVNELALAVRTEFLPLPPLPARTWIRALSIKPEDIVDYLRCAVRSRGMERTASACPLQTGLCHCTPLDAVA